MQNFRGLFQRFGFCLLLWLLLQPLSVLGDASKPRIALFIPEYSAFWSRLAEFTQASANDLSVDLQILAAGPPRGEPQKRNMLRQVEQVLQQDIDGILFVNFQGIGEDILQRSQAAGVPALLINTALDDRSLQPRSRYPLWIGSILPDDREAGLRLATSLISEASRKGASTYRIFAFTGYPNERSHQQRLEALQSLAAARPDVELTVLQQNTQDGDQADEQFLAALREHPDINILWSYKDPLALQAGKALQQKPPLGVDPRRIAIGGIDWNPDALQGIRNGYIDLDIGGHVLDGALGLILLSDYLRGYDFAEQGLRFPSMMSIARADNIDPLITLFERPDSIDFRELSRRFNPQRKQYRFDLDSLLASHKGQSLALTEQEKAWLQAHPRIRLAVDINWAPMEFLDEQGQYSGLSAEFVHYFERQLGIRFEPPPRLSWSGVIAALKNRELDLAPMLMRTPERQKFLLFTRPYLNFPVVVFTRNDSGVLGDIGELRGRRVGVVRDYAIAELLRRDYPNIQLVEFNDNESGFNALALGQIDAFVDLLATGAYLIADKGLSNIQVAALTPYDHGFSMGVRKDWPELVSILDKAIAALPPEQKNAFVHKWLNVQFQQKVDYRLVSWVIAIALIIVLLFAFRAWEMSRVNRKLQESQRRLALSLSGGRLGTWELHRQPDGQEWLDWDQNFAEQHGLPGPAQHQPLSLLLDRLDEEEQIDHALAALQACIEGRREGMRFEYSIHRGQQWIHIEGQVFERNAQGLRLVGISQDITDRIEASRLLQQSSEFKSQFLANMSHEIRTPMNAIVGLGHLLSRTPLNAQQKGYVHNLQSSAHTLLTLVNDILDFSKIEAGHLDIDHIEFDLEELLADLARLNALRIGDKPVEFLYDIQPDVPVQLIGDPFRVNQVLTNLVSNAIKFTEHGSIILRVLRIEGDRDQARLRFEVQDTGIGIEAEQMEGLFDAFVQADGSTTRRFGGTGLGLSISKQLVELMGGEIHADSEPGQGSRFWFDLPFDLANERCARYLPSNGNLDLRGLRVLLVDDNDMALQILGSMLQAMSFEVTTVNSGEKALARLQQQEFDLVLLDWRMPRMSGDRLSAEIRSRLPRQKLPIIIMITAYGREADEQALDMRQLDGFLVKPITPSQLFNAIIMARHANTEASAPRITVDSTDEPTRPSLRGRVMLAEDNPINQQVAQELLEQMGLQVVICDSGREVLERIDEASPDLVLMDIQMPELDGHETTRRLREDPRWSDLPILAMTANAMADDVRKALQHGMNAHIAKPVDPDLLYRMLSQFLPVENQPQAETGNRSARKAEDWPDQVPGIEIRRGIAQVGGNATLYRKLLGDFLRNHGDSANQLERHLEENDVELAERLLHTLKGVAANVGAVRLAEAAARLDESLRKGELPLEGDLAELRQALEEVRSSLLQLDTAYPDPRSQTSSPGTSDIEQLRQALKDGDSHSAELFHALREELCAERGEKECRQLQQLIEDYEFDAALEWLKKC